MLEENLSHKIIGIAMRLQNQYGSQHNERIYQKGYEEQLTKEGIAYVGSYAIWVENA
ncbi:MAG: GxxExxY protein [Candidatus Uhrbacteria bacterium]|nr:GxxExxY protein [Candidatus Uhrbacteria bacterium]